jgi:hypothetical protein
MDQFINHIPLEIRNRVAPPDIGAWPAVLSDEIPAQPDGAMVSIQAEMDVVHQFWVVVIDAGIDDSHKYFVMAVVLNEMPPDRDWIHRSFDVGGQISLIVTGDDTRASKCSHDCHQYREGEDFNSAVHTVEFEGLP